MIEVVIPARNAGRFLRDTLRSVVAQTRPPALVTVVDDRSEDGTRAVAEAAAAEFGNRLAIRVIRNAGPAGPAAARNTAIRASDQPLIALLDADDLLLPGHHATLAGLLQATPDAVLAFGDCSVFDHASAAVRVTSHHARCGITPGQATPLHAGGLTLGDAMFAQLLRTGMFGTSACLVRREALLEAGLFDEAMMYSEDTDLFLRLALGGRFAFTPAHVARKREHGANLSHARHDLAFVEGRARSLTKMVEHGGELPFFAGAALAQRLPGAVQEYLYEASLNGLAAYRRAWAFARRLDQGRAAFRPRHLARLIRTIVMRPGRS